MPVFTAFAFLILGALLHLRFALYLQDDAYIHLRIASHLVHNAQPYFNLDAPVMGSTSPVWTLVLAGAGLLFPLTPTVVSVLNCFFLFGATVAVPRALVAVDGSEHLPSVSWLQFLTFSLLLESSLAGMETPLSVLLLGAGAASAAQGRARGFFLIALAGWTRPELFVAGILCFAAFVYHQKVRPLVALSWGVLASVPIACYQIFFFGSLIPETAVTKRLVYAMRPEETIRHILHYFSEHYAPSAPRLFFGLHAEAEFAALVYLVSKAVERMRSNRSALDETGLILILVGALTITGYVVGAAFIFEWYAPLFLLPLCLGAALLARGPFQSMMALPVFVPPILLLSFTIAGAVENPNYYPGFTAAARVRRLIALGSKLAIDSPSATLLAPEVGGIGYGFPGPVTDALGLVSTDARRFYPVTWPDGGRHFGAVPIAMVDELQPELIVGLEQYLAPVLAAPVARHYQVQQFSPILDEDRVPARDARIWGSRSTVVMTRVTESSP